MTLVFAANPFSCQAPIGSNDATGYSCNTQGKYDILERYTVSFNFNVVIFVSEYWSVGWFPDGFLTAGGRTDEKEYRMRWK